MKFTRYDIWTVFLGIAIGAYFLNNSWKVALAFLILAGFAFGWQSIYHPKKYKVDYRDPEELANEDELAYKEYLAKKAAYEQELRAEQDKTNGNPPDTKN